MIRFIDNLLFISCSLRKHVLVAAMKMNIFYLSNSKKFRPIRVKFKDELNVFLNISKSNINQKLSIVFFSLLLLVQWNWFSAI